MKPRERVEFWCQPYHWALAIHADVMSKTISIMIGPFGVQITWGKL